MYLIVLPHPNLILAHLEPNLTTRVPGENLLTNKLTNFFTLGLAQLELEAGDVRHRSVNLHFRPLNHHN